MVDISTPPTPHHITLLFKHHKSTVLLPVLPEESFSKIKDLLLSVLRSRNIDAFPGSDEPLPEDAQQLEFGILKDKRDPTKGFILLKSTDEESAGNKSGKKKLGLKKTAPSDSPAGAGLTEHSIIAYRLSDRNASPNLDDDEEMVTDISNDRRWNVVLPSYDDEPEEDA